MRTLEKTASNASMTPWAKGSLHRFGKRDRLLFGATYEDPLIELAALKACENVLCISGAGDTVRALAANGHNVTALDINGAQIAYAVDRTNGGPFRRGAAERVMAIGRTILRTGGWSPSRIDSFVGANNIEAQLEQWRALTGGTSGVLLRTLLSPARLAAAFQPQFVSLVGPGFSDRLLTTLTAALSQSVNCYNPFVPLLFQGRPATTTAVAPTQTEPRRGRLTFLHTDAVAYLSSLEAGTFDGASLSNIGDGAPTQFHESLNLALQHAVRPGSPVVVRSMGDLSKLGSTRQLGVLAALAGDSPDPDRLRAVQVLAATDRSLIWSGVEVQRA
jgi:hypothetical protein